MVNILLDFYDINSSWLFDTLKNYIKPQYKVAIIAFSFRDNQVKNLMDWNALYGKNGGKYYGGLVNALMAYGIDEDNIEFLNKMGDLCKDFSYEDISTVMVVVRDSLTMRSRYNGDMGRKHRHRRGYN